MPRRIAAVLLGALLALLGCGRPEHTLVVDRPLPEQAEPLGELRRRLHTAFAHTIPPHALAALQQFTAPVASTVFDGKRPAVSIPHTFPANKKFTLAGRSGYTGLSADAVVTAGAPPIGHVALTPPGSTYPANFSYALYRVDGVTQTVRTLKVSLGASTGKLGVAAYNWAYGSLGRWEPRLYANASPSLEVALDDLPAADYVSPAGNLFFFVFCLGPHTLNVRSFELSDLSSNIAPYANLFATECSDSVPLLTTLDASISSDSGGIVRYRFDPEGRNHWIDNGSDPDMDYIYTTPGPYVPRVEVTDNLGLVSRAAAHPVVAEPAVFDEVEDNDSFATAQPVTLPFSLLSGNVGSDGPYDGDEADFFSFSAAAGEEIRFQCFYCREPGNIDFNMLLELYDSDDPAVPLDTSDQDAHNLLPASLFYTIKPADSGPFYLKVKNTSNFSYSYYLAGGPPLNEVEDNDTPEQVMGIANEFTSNLVGDKQVSDWTGSLGFGADYQGNDGDDDDWLYFTAAPGITVDITLDYAAGTGNLGAALYDGFGDVLAVSASGDGSEQISYTFTAGDPNPILLHLAPLPGTFSDYSLSATLDTPNPGFDEAEDNDSPFAASPLPAFPFASYTGNIGVGGQYDQDALDYLTFPTTVGDLVRFTITPAVTQRTRLLARISDSDIPAGYDFAPLAQDDNGIQQVVFVVRPGMELPWVLGLENFSSDPVDYSIAGEVVTVLDEVEDNDVKAEASQITGGLFTFAGNLGAGVDGDLLDWLSFTAEPGEDPRIYVLCNPALEFDLADAPPTIEDSEGDIMSSASLDSDSGGLLFEFNLLEESDLAPFYIKLNAESGASNYWIQRSE